MKNKQKCRTFTIQVLSTESYLDIVWRARGGCLTKWWIIIGQKWPNWAKGEKKELPQSKECQTGKLQTLFFKRCWDCGASFEKLLEAALHSTPPASHVQQHSNSRLLWLLALTSHFLLICPPYVSLKHWSQFISPAWVLTLCVGFSSFFPLVLDFLMGWLEKKNVSFWPSFLSAKYTSVL